MRSHGSRPPLARGQADRLRLLAPDLTVVVHGDPHVPVTGDADRLTQVLANLTDNARRAWTATAPWPSPPPAPTVTHA